MKASYASAFGALVATLVVATAGCAPTHSSGEASPIYGVTIPDGYRQWELIAPSQETGDLDELRGILGNAVAMRAFRDGSARFPD